MDEGDFVEILSIPDPFTLAIVKSILEREEIVYYFKGEYSAFMKPLMEPVRLMVKTEQADIVRAMLLG